MLPEKKNMRNVLSAYIQKGQIVEFDEFEYVKKLALVQTTPKRVVKTRTIKGNVVQYLEHKYCRKLLNFLFAFDIDSEVTQCDYHFYQEKTSKGTKEVVEADLLVKFTFHLPNGRSIIRTVASSHKQFPNPALTRGAARAAALSKSWTQVAKTFGIGDDLNGGKEVELDMDYIEGEFVDHAIDNMIENTEETHRIEKSFENFNYSPTV